MKNTLKRCITFLLALSMILSLNIFSGDITEVQAARRIYVNPYSANQVVTYKPDSYYGSWSSTISIVGCSKASDIKKLKSSNPSVCRVRAAQGYINVYFYKKAGTAKITCTVKGVKLSTKFTVKKYTNPFSLVKVGNTNYTSKFNKNDEYEFYHTKRIKNKTLSLKTKKDWKITNVSYYHQYDYNRKTVNSSKYTRKVSFDTSHDRIYVTCYNKKSKITEEFELHSYME